MCFGQAAREGRMTASIREFMSCELAEQDDTGLLQLRVQHQCAADRQTSAAGHRKAPWRGRRAARAARESSSARARNRRARHRHRCGDKRRSRGSHAHSWWGTGDDPSVSILLHHLPTALLTYSAQCEPLVFDRLPVSADPAGKALLALAWPPSFPPLAHDNGDAGSRNQMFSGPQIHWVEEG